MDLQSKFTPEKYAEFRRIYPLPRLSYSLYKYWIKNNWTEVWNYLANFQYYKSAAMTAGSELHDWIHKNGVPEWLAGLIDEEAVHIEEKLIYGIDVDNLNKPLTEKEALMDYAVVTIPDIRTEYTYIVDWKYGGVAGYEKQLSQYSWQARKLLEAQGKDSAGTYTRNIVVGVEPIRNADGFIVGVRKRKTHEYKVNETMISEWDLVFDEMNRSIRVGLEDGSFDEFLKYNYI